MIVGDYNPENPSWGASSPQVPAAVIGRELITDQTF
jgi:hypothetical protein